MKGYNSMENKTTTELLDLLTKLANKKGDLQEGYSEVLEELETREPFWTLLSKDSESSVEILLEEIEELKEEIKLLKRHKHDEKTNDVLVRI